jgi:uncharacterized protein (DUF2252 family)
VSAISKVAETSQALAFTKHLSRKELLAKGKALRDKCPRKSHSDWNPPKDRPDPVALIKEGDKDRLAELLPLRHARMLQSPFTFYRGAALNMAQDLAHLPATGVHVQCCGDAHLGNFRGFGTPERHVNFDIHDLDETLPAPWEWDVKRLATSFVVACRDNGFSKGCAEDSLLTCVRSYREHMAEYSEMDALDVWYAKLDADKLVANMQDAEARHVVRKRLAKERARGALEHDFPKLVHSAGELLRIKENPPTIYHPKKERHAFFPQDALEAFSHYRETLPASTRVLLERYEFKDIAVKVVGVGSVGTRCFVLLLMADEKAPLFLQVKEARSSVLEAYAGKSAFRHHGERVVNGHRMMQSASDIFLGWTTSPEGRHFYIRQMRDVKVKPIIENFTPSFMVQFAEWCGHTLARAHARSGDAAVISGYLGKSDAFDEAIAVFSVAYADQTERDHAALEKAVRNGRLEVLMERG